MPISDHRQQVTAVIDKEDVDRIDRVQELDLRKSRSATIEYLIIRGLQVVEKELGVRNPK